LALTAESALAPPSLQGGGVDAYLAAVVGEVLPWAEAAFGVSAEPAMRVFGGSSFGGICALMAGLRHPGGSWRREEEEGRGRGSLTGRALSGSGAPHGHTMGTPHGHEEEEAI
jgi:hypothetical protein